MFSVSEAEILKVLGEWLWPFLRIGGLMMAAPIFGTRVVPVRVRMMLTLALGGVLIPVIAAPVSFQPLSSEGLLVGVQQVLIGACIGIVIRVAFFVMEFAGQIVAQQMGLGFASLVDPQTGSQVPVVSQFYIILATLFFFAINGHLMMISLVAESFQLLPIGTQGIGADGLERITLYAGELFARAVMIALPIIVGLLVVNIALGVMARSAPQLNIFAIGFPIMMMFGVVLLWLSLDNLTAHMQATFDYAMQSARQLVFSK